MSNLDIVTEYKEMERCYGHDIKKFRVPLKARNIFCMRVNMNFREGLFCVDLVTRAAVIFFSLRMPS